MVVRDLLGAGCAADSAKGMPGRCLAQFHGQDNSFHPQRVKAEARSTNHPGGKRKVESVGSVSSLAFSSSAFGSDLAAFAPNCFNFSV
jgi:hypothetical protein